VKHIQEQPSPSLAAEDDDELEEGETVDDVPAPAARPSHPVEISLISPSPDGSSGSNLNSAMESAQSSSPDLTGASKPSGDGEKIAQDVSRYKGL
jgi:hypothetical protein